MGLKKGMTNNPNGKPPGVRSRYSEKIKEVVARHFMESDERGMCELERILNELKVDSKNDIDLKDKLKLAYDYFRLVAPQAREESEVEAESQIKNVLYNRFFNTDKKSE